MEMAEALDKDITADTRALSTRMIVLGFLAQNLAVGMTYGVYGAFIKPFSESFGISRTLASSGLAIITLILGLSSPWVGSLVGRHRIANVMTAGAALMVAGFGLIAAAHSAGLILLI